MATTHKFVPKAERIAAAKAEEARQAVLNLELPKLATEDIMVAIARHETGGRLSDWEFNMISPAQCLAVWDAIWLMPRPVETRKVFDLVLTHIETNTGAVTLTREEIAAKVGTAPSDISRIMTQLEAHKVIFRRRLKGPGRPVRYYLNQHVAWNGKLEIRTEQAKQIPLPFAVIEGGKSEARS